MNFNDLTWTLIMLAFMFFWQVMALIAIFREWKTYKKIQQGIYTNGKVVDVRFIPGIEEDEHNYELTLDFFYPTSDHPYQIRHKISSLRKPELGREYMIWVNREKPVESIAVDQFGSYWVSKLIMFLIFIVGICYPEYLLIKKLFNEV